MFWFSQQKIIILLIHIVNNKYNSNRSLSVIIKLFLLLLLQTYFLQKEHDICSKDICNFVINLSLFKNNDYLH